MDEENNNPSNNKRPNPQQGDANPQEADRQDPRIAFSPIRRRARGEQNLYSPIHQEQEQNFESPPREQILRGNPDVLPALPNRNEPLQERQENIEDRRFGIAQVPFPDLGDQAQDAARQHVARQRVLPRPPIQPRAGNGANAPALILPDSTPARDGTARTPDSGGSRGR